MTAPRERTHANTHTLKLTLTLTLMLYESAHARARTHTRPHARPQPRTLALCHRAPARAPNVSLGPKRKCKRAFANVAKRKRCPNVRLGHSMSLKDFWEAPKAKDTNGVFIAVFDTKAHL